MAISKELGANHPSTVQTANTLAALEEELQENQTAACYRHEEEGEVGTDDVAQHEVSLLERMRQEPCI